MEVMKLFDLFRMKRELKDEPLLLGVRGVCLLPRHLERLAACRKHELPRRLLPPDKLMQLLDHRFMPHQGSMRYGLRLRRSLCGRYLAR